MHIDLEKILVHANEKLTVAGSNADQLDVFKRFLKIETERLRIRHRFGLGGTEITSGRSYVMDLIICRACEIAAEVVGGELEPAEYAVVALGGYGRRELAPLSDIDLLFLHTRRPSKSLKVFIEHVLYMLWDMGLMVGHSFRSVAECVAMAKDDLHSRNSMVDARPITGNSNLFRRLEKELEESVFRNKREIDSFLATMQLETEARYEKFGRTVCLQEPNVKESAGGLRDMHTAIWVGHAVFGSRTLDDLRAHDHISGAEYAAARRAYDFVARVRNEVHFSTWRRADLLTLELQPVLASNLGYKDKRGLLASEMFMREYYVRANELHDFAKGFLDRATRSQQTPRRIRSGIKRASLELRNGTLYLTLKRGPHSPQAESASFEVKDKKLFLKETPSDLGTNPLRLLEVFAVAQAESVELSGELKSTIRDNLSLVGRAFRASRDAGRVFMQMLAQRGRVGPVLRMMHETGFLGRFLPEFARITFLVQHDFYHKYTIDEHTIKAIEVLDHLAGEHDPKVSLLKGVFRELDDVAPLYLGLFLHDIGKGRGRGHVLQGVRVAERVCARLGLDESSARRVIFLVRHHLLMSHLSQRRDLNEEKLIEGLVENVEDITNLSMLMLLTYADTNGVGPGVWNDWKGGLLWELYTRARSHFVSGRQPRWDHNRKVSIKEQVKLKLLQEMMPSEVERHFAMMPDRYLRATEPERIVKHLKLTKRLSTGPLAADWRSLPDKHCSELTVCTRDRSGLFARIAGTLTANGVNILAADLYTREDGVVLDSFKVSQAGAHSPVKADKWPRIESNLKAAIDGGYDVAAAVQAWLAEFHTQWKRKRTRQLQRPPAVRFDSEASVASTVLEVRAEDQPGLAYKIASTLSALQIDISFARITTEKSHALDIFYVTGPDGQKLTADEMPAIERALCEALGGVSTPRLVKEAV
jgi:[protein-PII] uridylyltransferase